MNKYFKIFIKIIKKKITSFFLLVLLISFLMDVLFPPSEMKTYSKIIYAKDSTLLTAYLTDDDKWRMYSSLNEVSPELKKAIIEKEDKWFYWHPGFNPISLTRALITNITEGKRVSGASTITMQVVRLLEPKKRNYLNKFIELIRAVQFELHYSKREILEIYFSILPYGGNIEGVKSASYLYFNRPPDKLSLAQAITLAVIPNNPNVYRIDRNVEAVISARNKLIKKLINNDLFLETNLKDASKEPLKPNRYYIPNRAPHLSNSIKFRLGEREICTSLDLAAQTKAEDLLWNYVQRVYTKGVTNGAVIVIDNKTHSVSAYCGSADFYNQKNSGQVDGVNAVRSPGSALKPFLYAYAFDLGRVTPKMKLLDIPTDYSGYRPVNYDNNFNGEVSLEFALVNSLNIPAVNLLNEIGVKELINLFEKGGLKNIATDKNKLGLSLILGGCGITLEELTTFYTVFSNRGRLYQLNYLSNKKENEQKSIKVFSDESSFIISEILSQNKRPDLPNNYLNSSKLPKIAWKTGTSYGKRDAWAIGYNPNFTIGVWMGNFDGKGSPSISGAEIAVPLLFDLFNAIDYNNKSWFKEPAKLNERKICYETGLLPGKYCKNITNDYFIKNVSHNQLCNLHKEIFVSDDNSVKYCPNCLPVKGFKKEIYPNYTPELELWFNENGIGYKKHPVHNVNCNLRFTNRAPIIISPSENYEYLIEKNSDNKLLLQAAANPGVKIYYWYINDKFYKKSEINENIFLKPSEGKIKITCLDDKGRDESIFINVRYY